MTEKTTEVHMADNLTSAMVLTLAGLLFTYMKQGRIEDKTARAFAEDYTKAVEILLSGERARINTDTGEISVDPRGEPEEGVLDVGA